MEKRTRDLAAKGELLTRIKGKSQQEEILWRQKSTIHWLQEGEKNTKVYHKSLIKHRRQNKIFSLKDQERKKLTDHKEMEQELVRYYGSLLVEPNQS